MFLLVVGFSDADPNRALDMLNIVLATIFKEKTERM